MTIVDTSILIDLAEADPEWVEWSSDRLRERALHGPLLINDVIYAELSVGFAGIEDLDEFVGTLELRRERSPAAALFLAARAHLRYRRQGGLRTGVLVDFFVGAHAAVRGATLLTRDPRRFRAYFPSLVVIAP